MNEPRPASERPGMPYAERKLQAMEMMADSQRKMAKTLDLMAALMEKRIG